MKILKLRGFDRKAILKDWVKFSSALRATYIVNVELGSIELKFELRAQLSYINQHRNRKKAATPLEYFARFRCTLQVKSNRK